MVIVPCRGTFKVFCATVYETPPLPFPTEPELIVIHGSLLLADHPQPEPVVTLTEELPPTASKIELGGTTMNTQFPGATLILQAGDVAVAPELSVTIPVKGNSPELVGVPETPPNEFRVTPGGRDPVLMA